MQNHLPQPVRRALTLALFALVVVPAGVYAMSQRSATAQQGTPTCDGREVTVDMAEGQSPTSGSDVIMGTDGPDLIAAGDGDDVVCGGGGADQIWGQAGDDRLIGEAGDDKLRGGDGNDTLFGGLGSDDLNGGRDNDAVSGGADDDAKVRGGTGVDVVNGDSGNDALVTGNGGEDQVSGGAGDDALVTGGPRPDVVDGGDGNDQVKGGGGADTVTGGTGNDTLFGGAQLDNLDGGPGTDSCNGGLQDDTATNCESHSNVEAITESPVGPTPAPTAVPAAGCDSITAAFVTKGSANANLPEPEVAAVCDGTTVTVTSNQIPDFPYIQTSPGQPTVSDLEFNFPVQPAAADEVSAVPALGAIAVAINGIPIYGATEGTGGDVMSLTGGFTECGGHNGPTGYHFHTFDVTGSDDCLFSAAEATAAPQLFGYAFDGYPIYSGNFQYSSSWELTNESLFATDTFSAHTYVEGSGDLDQCNGRTDENGNYAYYTTDTFPYTLGCYHGVVDADANGGPGGGGPGGPPPGDGGPGGPPPGAATNADADVVAGG